MGERRRNCQRKTQTGRRREREEGQVDKAGERERENNLFVSHVIVTYLYNRYLYSCCYQVHTAVPNPGGKGW